jgi:hypothetical protein
MHKLKDIKQEIQQQHRQLAFNRRELNLRRWELRQTLQQALHSKGLLLGSFASGLLLGWWGRRPARGSSHTPVSKGLKGIGHWFTPIKSVLWSGLIKTASSYTSDKLAEGLYEHHHQRG